MRVITWCALFAVLTMVSTARADIFVFVSAGNSNVNIVNVAADSSFPDNDNVIGASPNFVDLDLEVFVPTQGDLRFVPDFTPGTTEYFATTTMLNSTGMALRSFSLQIGEGFFDGTTDTFVPQLINDVTVTNFDFPDFDSPFDSNVFSSVDIGAHVITFSGGTVNPGESVTVRFSVDVPTNQPVTTFRGSFQPVPEPSMLLPLATAALLFSCRWRSRKR